MKRVVALKVMSRSAMDSPQAVSRFRREVQIVAQLKHPNIAAAFDADQDKDVHFLVTEFVDGSDLHQIVKGQGPLPVGKAVNCIVQVARGLAHAHAAGVVHRDIKPSNLLVNRQGVVKILDLGLARMNGVLAGGLDEASLTQSGHIMGTVDYMAPEQAMNPKGVDHRADIYSLGCTLYFLLTAKAMYAGETAVQKLLAHRQQPIPCAADRAPGRARGAGGDIPPDGREGSRRSICHDGRPPQRARRSRYGSDGRGFAFP